MKKLINSKIEISETVFLPWKLFQLSTWFKTKEVIETGKIIEIREITKTDAPTGHLFVWYEFLILTDKGKLIKRSAANCRIINEKI